MDADVHGHLVRLLAPLNRSQRKERITLLIYQGLDMELMRRGATVTHAASIAPPVIDIDRSNYSERQWKPTIEGNAFEELGLSS